MISGLIYEETTFYRCAEDLSGERFFPKDVSLLWFSNGKLREKLRKSASNDLLRLTVREPGPESHERARSYQHVGQKLRTGPQVSPNTSPDEPARAHLDSCGRRAGASPHRPQPPSRAQGSSEEYPRMHHNAPGCTRMHHDAPGCNRVHEDTPECTRMQQNAPGCTRTHHTRGRTRMHQAGPECVRMHRDASECTRMH